MKQKEIKAWRSLDGWDEFCEGYSPQGESSAENKLLLLEMAKKGESRPAQRKHSLGIALCRYTAKFGDCYDPIFDKQIQKLL